MSGYLNNWSFRSQRFLFPSRKLVSLSNERFVFVGNDGEFLCGLKYVDIGLKQWAFCITCIVVQGKEDWARGAELAVELRNYVLSHGAKECLVLRSQSGWPKDAFSLQKDGIIWDAEKEGQP